MSYILYKAGSSISTPVSIANGGTGGTSKSAAMTNLSSTNFNTSAQSSDWGNINVPESGAADPNVNQAALNALIQALVGMGGLG